MDKWISYDKLSKKEKRKHNQAKRQTWGVVSPSPENRLAAGHIIEEKRRIGERMPLILKCDQERSHRYDQL